MHLNKRYKIPLAKFTSLILKFSSKPNNSSSLIDAWLFDRKIKFPQVQPSANIIIFTTVTSPAGVHTVSHSPRAREIPPRNHSPRFFFPHPRQGDYSLFNFIFRLALLFAWRNWRQRTAWLMPGVTFEFLLWIIFIFGLSHTCRFYNYSFYNFYCTFHYFIDKLPCDIT